MISASVQRLLPAIRAYLSTQPIEKAWLFGSCSRGEEGPTSDIDILVRYNSGTLVSLFAISKITIGLESVLNRPVDLVEEGHLLPFAQESANHDKLLIYERTS